MCLTLQSRTRLFRDLQLQGLDFPQLIANLLLQHSGRRGLPLLLLRKCGRLVVLLYQQIAGIACIPNEAIWLYRSGSELDSLRHTPRFRSEFIPGSRSIVDYERSTSGLALAHDSPVRSQAFPLLSHYAILSVDLIFTVGKEGKEIS